MKKILFSLVALAGICASALAVEPEYKGAYYEVITGSGITNIKWHQPVSSIYIVRDTTQTIFCNFTSLNKYDSEAMATKTTTVKPSSTNNAKMLLDCAATTTNYFMLNSSTAGSAHEEVINSANFSVYVSSHLKLNTVRIRIKAKIK
jgi:hypothetical protein